MPRDAFRQDVSIPGLLSVVRRAFEAIAESKKRCRIPLTDHLMSGLAVFGLKYPSLLQFDRDSRATEITRHHLCQLYGIKQAPCDSHLRARLDEVDPANLRAVYKQLFRCLQRGKGLEGFEVFDGHYLLSVDGTGYFSSQEIHCEQCCEKHHRDGQVTYYHQLLGAVLVHPDGKEVFPLMPEPIIKQDGVRKNDCERNAAKRLLSAIRKDHPHLKLVVVEDALSSNGPHIKHLQSLNYRFILGAKQSDHAFLYDWVNKTPGVTEHGYTDERGYTHRYRYLNGAPLNDAHFDLGVNFLEYGETSPKGKTRHFAWVTDIEIDANNAPKLMRAGRARWRIENETFNTLKNQGYHFEHNYGHGHRHLTTVLMHLMMLAFLIDQIQQRCCGLFHRGLEYAQSKMRFWRLLRGLFDSFLIPDWEALYRGVAGELKPTIIPLDTS